MIISKKTVRILIILISIFSILIPTFKFLNSINYQLKDYVNYAMFSHRIRFKPHKEEFEILVNHTYEFIDEHPNFFDEFDEYYMFNNEGIIFYKKELNYPDNICQHNIYNNEWNDTIKNYNNAFPNRMKSINGNCVYPNYITFGTLVLGDILSGKGLLYTRNGKYPKELIEKLRAANKFVFVKKHAKGWYEIHCYR